MLKQAGGVLLRTYVLCALGCGRELPVVDDEPVTTQDSKPAASDKTAAGSGGARASALPNLAGAAAPTPREPSAPNDEDVASALPYTPAELAQAPKFVCAGALAPTVVSTEELTQDVAVNTKDIYYSAQNGLFRMPKDGSAAGVKVHSNFGIAQIALVGETLYFATSDLTRLRPNETTGTTVSTALNDGFQFALAADDTGLYVISTDGDVGKLLHIAPDETQTEIDIPSTQGLTVHKGIAYVISGADDKVLYKVGPDHVPQVLARDLSIGDDLAVTDSYIYFWTYPDDGRYLARLPVQGGKPEIIAGRPSVRGHLHAADDEVLIEIIDGPGSICVVRYDEASQTLSAYADVSNISAITHDAANYYFATNRLVSVPR